MNRIIEVLSTDYTDSRGLLNNSIGRDERPARPKRIMNYEGWESAAKK